VIKQIESLKKKADVYREFGSVSSIIQPMWKNRDKIVSAFEENGSQIKRLRKPERSDVDEALLKWSKQKKVKMFRLAVLYYCPRLKNLPSS
jgi:hypothetical protein